MKKCIKCKESKDAEHFQRSAGSRDGLDAWCKDCRKAEYIQKKAETRNRPASRKAWADSVLRMLDLGPGEY